jgi:rhodanese-related sulfurtransferase
MFGNIKEVDIQTLAQWQQDEGKKLRLIDVRSVNEIARGIIPAGEVMPMHTLPLHMDKLSQETVTILYCHSGARSAQACAFLGQQGFENVYNLRGGIVGWAQQGLPLAYPDSDEVA